MYILLGQLWRGPALGGVKSGEKRASAVAFSQGHTVGLSSGPELLGAGVPLVDGWIELEVPLPADGWLDTLPSGNLIRGLASRGLPAGAGTGGVMMPLVRAFVCL